jgi:hypothetical protein
MIPPVPKTGMPMPCTQERTVSRMYPLPVTGDRSGIPWTLRDPAGREKRCHSGPGERYPAMCNKWRE